MSHGAVKERIHPREKLLRGAIIALPVFAVPLAAGIVVGVHALIVLGAVAGGIDGGFVVLFYAIWTVGYLGEGDHWSRSDPKRARLIGDSRYNVPCPYWPWSAEIRQVRHRRYVRELEQALDFATRDYWYEDD